MNLEQTLRSAVGRLRSGQLDNEAQVKHAVILPTLHALEWDYADPGPVKAEYSAGSGRVDYALQDSTSSTSESLEIVEGAHEKTSKSSSQLIQGNAKSKEIPQDIVRNLMHIILETPGLLNEKTILYLKKEKNPMGTELPLPCDS